MITPERISEISAEALRTVLSIEALIHNTQDGATIAAAQMAQKKAIKLAVITAIGETVEATAEIAWKHDLKCLSNVADEIHAQAAALGAKL